jgi:hypothetical protein
MSSSSEQEIPDFVGGHRSLTPAQHSGVRFDDFPLCVESSPPKKLGGFVKRQSQRTRRADVDHYTSDVRESNGNMTMESNSNRARRNYIFELLRFQRFDGSFQFSTRAEAQATLGADIASALLDLMGDAVPDTVIYTAAAVILLERDFASHQALWGLMHDKAVAYLQKHGEGGYDTAEVAEKLKGLAICLGNDPTRSSHHPKRPLPDDCSRDSSPRRVAVDLAPDDEDDKGRSEKELPTSLNVQCFI